MKTYVTKSSSATTGFALVVEHDDGTSSMQDINKLVEDGHTLALPDNPSGRKYLSIVRAGSADKVELTPRGTSVSVGVPGPRSNKISFSEDELSLLAPEVVDVIRKAYESLQKNREKARLQALIDKYIALQNGLMAQMEE